MNVVFPNNPLRPTEVEPDYREERDAAIAAGFACHLYSHERLLDGDAAGATRTVRPTVDGVECMMRGWMIPESQYAALHAALAAKGVRLMNDPTAYAEAHYLPRALPLIEDLTPRTVWTATPDVDAAWAAYQSLRDGDAIVKDWVKSAKHRWEEACFLPAGSTREHFGRVLAALVDDRGRLFEHGFVLREFVPLVTEGRDMRGHPFTRETRLFFLDGGLIVRPRPEFLPPTEWLARVTTAARRFRNRFVTIDVAPTAAGQWTVIESGDAGVSGLPVSLLAEDFYAEVAERLGVG